MYKKYLFYFIWMRKIIKITFQASTTKDKISKIIKSMNNKTFFESVNYRKDFESYLKKNSVDYKNLQVEITRKDDVLREVYAYYETYIKADPKCARERISKTGISETGIDEIYAAIQSFGYLSEDDNDFYSFYIASKVEVNENIKLKTICQKIRFDCTNDTYEYKFKIFTCKKGYVSFTEKDREVLNGGMRRVMGLTSDIDKIKAITDI